VSNSIGLAALIVVATTAGVPGQALRRLREGTHRLPPWELLAGTIGALFVMLTTSAAPKVGIARLIVALVCGQAIGSLIVDRAGLSPAGTRPVTRFRLLGVALALVAVLIGAFESSGPSRLGLLALIALLGMVVALQQAWLGDIAQATGEPVAAGLANFLVGTPLLVAVALVATGGSPPSGTWSAPAIDWIGGLLGASIVVIMATVVRALGVLRLTLTLVAGQSVGGLALDVVAPAPGKHVTLATVLSVMLTLVAVWISGTTGVRRRLRG
jgi:transporter family-2 protein